MVKPPRRLDRQSSCYNSIVLSQPETLHISKQAERLRENCSRHAL